MAYNSAHTGPVIDSAISAVVQKEKSWDSKLPLSGGELTGNLKAPNIEVTTTIKSPIIVTGESESSYFQSRRFRGEGDAGTYYHAVDFGYAGHNQVDFHEYGGVYNFYKNTEGTADGGVLIGSITVDGFTGNSATSTKLQTPRTITLQGGDIVNSAFTFDGSQNVSANIVLKSSGVTAGSYGLDKDTKVAFGGSFNVPYITVNAKGIVTGAYSKKITMPSANFLPLSGGTLTGNLTGKYITGTWLQSSTQQDLGKTPPYIAVMDASGWIYYRTPSEIRSDIGAQASLGFIPVQQGGGTDQLNNNKIHIGWSGSQLKVTVDSTDLGVLMTTGGVDPTVLPISKGGTGSSTATAARSALSVYSKSQVNAKIKDAIGNAISDSY